MTFRKFAFENTVVFDGAMGTTIQTMNLPDSLWREYQGNNEILCLTAPDVIKNIHSTYFDAGCDIALTNTFGANGVVLSEYGLQSRVAEINTAAVHIARQAAGKGSNRYVALSVGPGSKLPTLSQISYDTLYNAYYEQIMSAVKVGIDAVMIETCQDLLQVKAAIAAAMDVNTALSVDIPIMVSLTVEDNGSMLVGSDMKCAAHVLSGYPLFSLGLNCSFGPDKMAVPLAELASSYSGRLYLSPNAGIPVSKEGVFVYPMDAFEFARLASALVSQYSLFAAGGCCGTTYAHIKALAAAIKGLPASERGESEKLSGTGFICSAYASSSLRQQPAPALIGERANATGSKVFRELLKDNNYSAMANIAKAQQEASHIIDLSVALSGRDEAVDMRTIASILNRELILPLMIDSTSDVVLEQALKHITGKPVINSVNFEDGGDKLHKILKLVKYFPAAVVALTIDESGMAQTKEDKLGIAERLYDVWVNEYGYSQEDLIIDFLTFSVASGDEGSRYAAVHTLGAIREFKQRHPQVSTTLGVSNVSFGLSAHSRTVLNAVFLDKAVKAGLDTAIVHAEKVLPISSIGDTDLKLCNALLDGEEDALDMFIAHFADVKEHVASEENSLPPEEELPRKILQGDSTGLEPLISTLLEKHSAADILNNILLKAMQDVGVLFNEGRLLLPFVLKSAEVMKACTTFLEPYLKGETEVGKGTVVLATVKGDVHDIGKNLVDIILTGNGYKVINIGTKISGEEIAKAAFDYDADAIGMSGLLVKSVEIMKENIKLFRELALDTKILLGGAALSEDYVKTECEPLMPGRVFYCKDAFAGVAAMNGVLESIVAQPVRHESTPTEKNVFVGKEWDILPFEGKIIADFYGNSASEMATLEDILPFLHKKSLFEGRWGVRKTGEAARDAAVLAEAEDELSNMLAKIAPLVQLMFIYGFYPVIIKKNELWIKREQAQSDWEYFASFPTGPRMECFTDLYTTASDNAVLPLQVVTLGHKIAEFIGTYYEKDRYEHYYKYHGLLAELTEALATYVQQKTASFLHFIFPERDIKVGRIWRYSFGYPFCPDLEGNRALCEVLEAQRIGIMLTENLQMEPEYSTCAMLSWHPQSRY